MKNLTYLDFCNYYASKCKICQSARRVKREGVWTSCICQSIATAKWHLEQFEVNPPSLKYKNWDDFTGTSCTGEHKLTDASFVSAKSKALEYCFGTTNVLAAKDRAKNLVVHKHRYDGKNIIIAGSNQSGKTLISFLIIKEVVYACQIFNLGLTFKCVNFNLLRDAACWDQKKTIDHDFFGQLAEIDFLVIDGVENFVGGHNRHSDVVKLNVLFRSRMVDGRPTIIVCSMEFWRSIKDTRYVNQFRQLFGEEFLALLMKPENIVIELEKDAI